MLVNIIAKRNIPFILLLLFSFLLISCDLFEKTDDNAEKDDKQDEFCRLNLRGYVDINSPEFLTISPDNKHVYVCASGGTPGVYWFKRDIETGWLYGDIFTDYFSVGWTNVIAISPDGRQVYANDTMTFSIICLQRDLDTGVLDNPKDKSVPGVSFFTLTPDGKHLYSTDGMNIYWLTRDLYTGELYGDPTNDFINIPSGVNDIIVSPDGKHLYSTGGMNVYWLTRDFETGRLGCDQMSDYINIPDVNLIGISISPDGKHIYSNDNTLQEIGSLSRDLATGKLNNYNYEFSYLNNIDWITLSSDGKNLFAISSVNTEIIWFERDIKTGSIGEYNMMSSMYLGGANVVKVTPDGKHVYVSAQTGGSTFTGAIVFFDRDLEGNW